MDFRIFQFWGATQLVLINFEISTQVPNVPKNPNLVSAVFFGGKGLIFWTVSLCSMYYFSVFTPLSNVLGSNVFLTQNNNLWNFAENASFIILSKVLLGRISKSSVYAIFRKNYSMYRVNGISRKKKPCNWRRECIVKSANYIFENIVFMLISCIQSMCLILRQITV